MSGNKAELHAQVPAQQGCVACAQDVGTCARQKSQLQWTPVPLRAGKHGSERRGTGLAVARHDPGSPFCILPPAPVCLPAGHRPQPSTCSPHPVLGPTLVRGCPGSLFRALVLAPAALGKARGREPRVTLEPSSCLPPPLDALVGKCPGSTKSTPMPISSGGVLPPAHQSPPHMASVSVLDMTFEASQVLLRPLDSPQEPLPRARSESDTSEREAQRPGDGSSGVRRRTASSTCGALAWTRGWARPESAALTGYCNPSCPGEQRPAPASLQPSTQAQPRLALGECRLGHRARPCTVQAQERVVSRLQVWTPNVTQTPHLNSGSATVRLCGFGRVGCALCASFRWESGRDSNADTGVWNLPRAQRVLGATCG